MHDQKQFSWREHIYLGTSVHREHTRHCICINSRNASQMIHTADARCEHCVCQQTDLYVIETSESVSVYISVSLCVWVWAICGKILQTSSMFQSIQNICVQVLVNFQLIILERRVLTQTVSIKHKSGVQGRHDWLTTLLTFGPRARSFPPQPPLRSLQTNLGRHVRRERFT